MKSQRLNLPKGSITAILLTLACGISSAAQGQEARAGTASGTEKTSSLSATGASSLEQVKSSGQSEQERLLLKLVDKQDRGLAKSDVRVSTKSGSDSNDAVTTADSSLSRNETVAQAPVADESNAPSQDPSSAPSQPQWQYGGFVDLGYLLDFNHPANRIFRSRGTAWHVDRVHLNMAGAYLRKKATEESRWGVELTAQAGKDVEVFGFSATAPNIAGFKFLRHLGPTNVSYLAPMGKGLTLQAGIFTSLIGYDSLYAKDNFNYTRPWGADFTPYLMMGVKGSYPFNEKLTGTVFVVNGYWHLARANNVPSSGGQLAYKLNPRVTLKETVLLGPHQANKSFKFWRFLSDTLPGVDETELAEAAQLSSLADEIRAV